MKTGSPLPPGLIAGGLGRYLRSEEFRRREAAVHAAVDGEFAPKLAAAEGWRERLRVSWQWRQAIDAARRDAHPSPQSCFAAWRPALHK